MNTEQMLDKLHNLRLGASVRLSDEDVCYLIRKLKAAERLADEVDAAELEYVPLDLELAWNGYNLADEPEEQR